MGQKLLHPDWEDLVVYSENGAQPQTLAEFDRVKVVVGGLQAGQTIPPHPEGVGVYHFVEGRGWMTVNGERFPVQPGATVIVPAGGERGLEAETRLAFLATRVA
jgi:quercetin dioxygenase-like cupin family protein